MQPITICLASDENYAQHSGALIHSILANHKTKVPIDIHFLDGGIKEDTEKKLIEITNKFDNARLIFHKMGNLYKEFSGGSQGSAAMYYRLKVPELLPNTEKAIYMDIDVIVLQDIEDLWNIDISHQPVAAVEDIGLHRNLDSIRKRLHLPSDARYFNSGVLLMNLTQWRKENISAKLLEYLQQNPDLIYPDQDALNVLFHDKALYLHPKWNAYKGIFHYSYKKNRPDFLTSPFIEAAKSPAIVHFTGSVKAWHYACGMPYADDYYVHLAKTPFKGYTPTDKNINSFLKRWEWKLKRILFKP